MTLYEKISTLYPELTEADFNMFNGGTILLQNEGNGDYIAKWEHPTLPRPTEDQLK